MKRLLLALLLFCAWSLALAAVNINTATKEELDALPGIGPVKAQAIIDYRNANGPFKTPEDIMKVKGIKEGEFSKIRGQIAVSGRTSLPAGTTAPAAAQPRATPPTPPAAAPATPASPPSTSSTSADKGKASDKGAKEADAKGAKEKASEEKAAKAAEAKAAKEKAKEEKAAKAAEAKAAKQKAKEDHAAKAAATKSSKDGKDAKDAKDTPKAATKDDTAKK